MSEGFIAQLWNIVGRSNLVNMFIRHLHTQIMNSVTLKCFYQVAKKFIFQVGGSIYQNI